MDELINFQDVVPLIAIEYGARQSPRDLLQAFAHGAMKKDVQVVILQTESSHFRVDAAQFIDARFAIARGLPLVEILFQNVLPILQQVSSAVLIIESLSPFQWSGVPVRKSVQDLRDFLSQNQDRLSTVVVTAQNDTCLQNRTAKLLSSIASATIRVESIRNEEMSSADSTNHLQVCSLLIKRRSGKIYEESYVYNVECASCITLKDFMQTAPEQLKGQPGVVDGVTFNLHVTKKQATARAGVELPHMRVQVGAQSPDVDDEDEEEDPDADLEF